MDKDTKVRCDRLQEELIERIRDTILEYDMLKNGETVAVGLSGGKDSVATVRLLSQLGYVVRPVAVNMGDPLFDVSFIKLSMKKQGFDVRALDARDPSTFGSLARAEYQQVADSLNLLDGLSAGTVVCTPCFNVKLLALFAYAKSEGISSIILGHHQDDMITSLLKCYWTDLYYRRITTIGKIQTPYNGETMRQLMREQKEIDLVCLESLVDRHLAATDEPFVEYPFDDGTRVVRPLGAIAESDVIAYMQFARAGTLEMDCTFKKNAIVGPFRRLVQDDYQRRLRKRSELQKILFDLVTKALNYDGTLKFRPRNKREENYPGFKPFISKL